MSLYTCKKKDESLHMQKERWVFTLQHFKSDLKTLTDGLVKISKGKLFHSLGAATEKVLLP